MSVIIGLGWALYGLIEGTVIGFVIEFLGQLSKVAVGVILGLSIAALAFMLQSPSFTTAQAVSLDGIRAWAWLGRIPGYVIGFTIAKVVGEVAVTESL